MLKSIYPWSIPPYTCRQEANHSLGRSRVHQQATKRHTHSQGSLGKPIKLRCMCWDCGRKLEYPFESAPSHGEHVNLVQKGLRASCCKGRVQTTTPLCTPMFKCQN